jgi:hypothetical protein
MLKRVRMGSFRNLPNGNIAVSSSALQQSNVFSLMSLGLDMFSVLRHLSLSFDAYDILVRILCSTTGYRMC